MKRIFTLYSIITCVFGGLIWFIIDIGKSLTPENMLASAAKFSSTAVKLTVLENLQEQFLEGIENPLGVLLLQVIVILVVSKLFGAAISKIGQAVVVGEMIAGIVLGPSVMGWAFPAFSDFVFPESSLNNLRFLSQIGLMFFMFIVGMELDINTLRNKAYKALVISHVSIVFPYFLGVAVSYILFEQFAPANIGFAEFAMFMGIAMSITAFPVLARILQERKLTKTPLGTITITCAAFDDVTAWCILAAIIAMVKAGSAAGAAFTIGFSVVFVLIMFGVVRQQIAKISSRYAAGENLHSTLVSVIFLTLLLSAWIAEVIGIHALFGAFLAGVIMPRNFRFIELFKAKIEDVSVLLLLPLFFALTGLRTQIGLLNGGHLWLYYVLVIFAAIAGKLGGSALAAKSVGYSWKDSFAIGALMNTRGLMELIVLNIGYDLGILSPPIFAIMVLMALTTTFMTGPLLDLIEYFNRKRLS